MKMFGVWKKLDESGFIHWNGLMSVYVDDILVTGEEFAVHGALQALSGVWTTSSVEWAGVDKPLKYCQRRWFFMSTSTCTSRRCCNVGMLMKELNILTTKLLRIKKLKKALTQTMSGRLKPMRWFFAVVEFTNTT